MEDTSKEMDKRINKKALAFIYFLVLVSFASANLGYFEKGSCVNIRTILNATSVNISTIYYPNETIALNNQPMTKLGQTFYYNFCNTNQTGKYTYDYYDNLGNTYVNEFYITFNGKEYPSGIVILGFSVVLIFILLSSTLILIRSVGFMIEGTFDLMDVAYNWGLYFALLGIFQLQKYYLGNEIYHNWVLLFIKVFAFPMIIVPIFAFFISIFRTKKIKRKEATEW